MLKSRLQKLDGLTQEN